MAMIASFALGDHVATLYETTGLTNPHERFHVLKVVDSTTGNRYSHSIPDGEQAAVLAFVAWIISDSDPAQGFPDLAKALMELRDSPMHKFMA